MKRLIPIVLLSAVLAVSANALTLTKAKVIELGKYAADFISTNKRVPNYLNTPDGKTMSPAEFFLVMAKWIPSKADVDVIAGISAPPAPSGVATNTSVTQAELVSVAQSIANFVTTNKRLPNYVAIKSGINVKPEIFYYMMANAIKFYAGNSRLPNYIQAAACNPPASWSSYSYVPPAAPATPTNTTINLAVPLYWQPDGVTCGPTSVRMILAYYGKNYSVQTIGNYCASLGDSPWGGASPGDPVGTATETQMAALKHFGLPNAYMSAGWTVLKQKITAKIPCIVSIKSVINPNGIHAAVAKGLTFNSAGSVVNVYLCDPSGGYKNYTGAFFDGLWKVCNFELLAPK